MTSQRPDRRSTPYESPLWKLDPRDHAIVLYQFPYDYQLAVAFTQISMDALDVVALKEFEHAYLSSLRPVVRQMFRGPRPHPSR